MFVQWALVVSFALAAFADSEVLPGSPEQRNAFIQHMKELQESYKNSPQATSLAREIQPYITAVNYAQATMLVDQFQAANIPQNAAQFTSWAASPLVYATNGPQPDYVQQMPSSVRDKYLNAQFDQMKAAASMARADFKIGAAPSAVPAVGWLTGAAASVVALVALVL